LLEKKPQGCSPKVHQTVEMRKGKKKEETFGSRGTRRLGGAEENGRLLKRIRGKLGVRDFGHLASWATAKGASKKVFGAGNPTDGG